MDKSAPFFITANDKKFMKSLYDFISSEKERLCSPTAATDEQRYFIYSAAFDKVIEHATSYKPILAAIKKEYDDFIAAVKTNDHSAKLAHGKQKAMIAQPTSLMYFQKRAAQLQERIAIIKRDTAEVQAELITIQQCGEHHRDSNQQQNLDEQAQNPVGQIPGLTLNESLSSEALEKHLKFLEEKRTELLKKKKSQFVPMQVKDELNIKMNSIMKQRDELALDNDRLRLRCKQLTFLKKAIDSWDKSMNLPLEEFLNSELKTISQMKVCETDYYGINTDIVEEDDPGKIKQSKLLKDYIQRFSDLFEGGEFEAAAYHAVKSPGGILINMETVELFRSVSVYKGELPPLLLFFQILMIASTPEDHLPGQELSLEGVRCALQHGYIEFVTFWVTQHRLIYSEELGDIICSHGDEDPRVADTCLALAHIVYTACGVLKKAALCLCRQGLASGALEFIYKNKGFTVEDCMFVLRGCPTLALMQDLTEPFGGKPALLSVGFICHSLLSTDLEDLAFQLLQKLYSDGQGVLEKTILDDVMSSVETWSEIATHCERKARPQLAQKIISTLLSQPGAVSLPEEQESALLMAHVFM
ncbi:clathrin heavy chain linker domain-containing protein 1-like [Hoplias malabaricus]|uniref:clathrin heavy chain linker domain-containing protein 1-like n=1 Tax=Hoplias malabaricus TaxID=27720 RepID=UPI0034630970